MASCREEVLVIGGLRFLGSHVIKQLCRDDFKVRAAVREKYDRSSDFDDIREHIPRAHNNLTLVPVDPESESSWVKAMIGCSTVHFCHLHLSTDLAREDKLAIDEVNKLTSKIFHAAKTANVRRVIMTSNQACVVGSNPNAGSIYTESNWADIDDPKLDRYSKIKISQEKTAWGLMESLREPFVFDLTVLIPGTMFGPMLTEDLPDTAGLLIDMLEDSKATLPRLQLCVVDVRDVAIAHVKAMGKQESADERVIVTGRSLWISEIADMVREEFMDYGYKITSKDTNGKLLKFLGVFKKKYKELFQAMDKPIQMDNDKMIKMLGVKPRDQFKTIAQTCHYLIDCDYVEPTKEYSRAHYKDSTDRDTTSGC